MGDKTKIEWADATWNPIVGCSKISDGCQNCYAEKMAVRLAHMDTEGYDEVVNYGGKWNGETYFVKSALDKPLRWTRPRRIFVCSMSDLFHESVDFHWIEKIWDVFHDCPQHTFTILTKRPARMHDFAMWMRISRFRDIDYPNVWIGVTAENQQAADERIPILLQIPAAVRFVSVEPMLGPVDLDPLKLFPTNECFAPPPKLDWVICGGESGPGARPMHPDWVRSLRDQCKAADVPFLFKQWGEWIDFQDATCPEHSVKITKITRAPMHTFKDGLEMIRVGKKKAGRLLGGVTWDQFPGRA